MGLEQSIPTPEGMQRMEAGMAMSWGEDKGAFVLPYMLGGLANFVMFGAALGLFFQWLSWVRRHGDRPFIFIMVLIVMGAAIASVIYVLCWITDLFVWNFGTYKTFSESRWPSGYAMIDNVMTLSVQTFYADRAYRLNKRKIWTLLCIVPTMFVSTGGAVGMYCQWYQKPWGGKALFEDPHVLLAFYLWAFGVLSTDIGITLTMAYGLRANKTGWQNLDKTLSTLIWLSLETQIPALCSAICLAVSYTQKQTTTVGIFFLMAHTHIYVIGLLAMLNYRSHLRAELSGAEQYFTDSRQGRGGGFSIPHQSQSNDTGVTEGPNRSVREDQVEEKVGDVERRGSVYQLRG